MIFYCTVLHRTGAACAHTLKYVNSQVALFLTPLRHSSQIGQPMELFHCPPSAAAAAAAPLCLPVPPEEHIPNDCPHVAHSSCVGRLVFIDRE